jgi:hypothetical protein
MLIAASEIADAPEVRMTITPSTANAGPIVLRASSL